MKQTDGWISTGFIKTTEVNKQKFQAILRNTRQANGTNKATLNKKKTEAGNDQDTNQIRQIAKAWTHHRQCWSETSESNPDSLDYLRGTV